MLKPEPQRQPLLSPRPLPLPLAHLEYRPLPSSLPSHLEDREEGCDKDDTDEHIRERQRQVRAYRASDEGVGEAANGV